MFNLQQIQHLHSTITILTIGGLVSICNLFVYCYYGKLATDSYAQFNNCFYNANWQDLSNGLQKYFIVMMANAQLPLQYHGLGIAILNLETFTRVS